MFIYAEYWLCFVSLLLNRGLTCCRILKYVQYQTDSISALSLHNHRSVTKHSIQFLQTHPLRMRYEVYIRLFYLYTFNYVFIYPIHLVVNFLMVTHGGIVLKLTQYHSTYIYTYTRLLANCQPRMIQMDFRLVKGTKRFIKRILSLRL